MLIPKEISNKESQEVQRLDVSTVKEVTVEEATAVYEKVSDVNETAPEYTSPVIVPVSFGGFSTN